MCDFLKKIVVISLFVTSSVLAMSDTEKERLQEEELLSLRTIFTMEGLTEEERKSLRRQIQSLESELQISKLPTSASSSSAPVSSLPFSRYIVEDELMKLRSMKRGGVEDGEIDKEIKLLEAAQEAGIKKYRSKASLRSLVMLFSKNPPR